MKQLYVFVLGLLISANSIAQEQYLKVVDSLYKEDQLYAGFTYNLLSKKPVNLSQSGFSLGLHLGFIKDMPINKNRNVAIGLGLGYSVNSINHNLLINKHNNGIINYSILAEGNTYLKNKFSNHIIEVPLEFRWRTSTFSDYNFWRIYTGFKFGYVFAHNTKYNGNLGRLKFNDIKDFNALQYGLTLSVGYNTWNIYMYYALNPIFSNKARLNGEQLDIKILRIGLMFYIL